MNIIINNKWVPFWFFPVVVGVLFSNALKTVEKSPERMRVTPVKAEVVEAGCRLPQNFSGDWVNTANIDADVFINETHLIETYYPDKARYRRTIYVCKEQRDTRIMMARLTVDGW